MWLASYPVEGVGVKYVLDFPRFDWGLFFKKWPPQAKVFWDPLFQNFRGLFHFRPRRETLRHKTYKFYIQPRVWETGLRRQGLYDADKLKNHNIVRHVTCRYLIWLHILVKKCFLKLVISINVMIFLNSHFFHKILYEKCKNLIW